MPHALVIGGSLGGLLAATLLGRIGWQVTVFERSAGDLAGRGAGLGISENLLEVLRRVGARIDPSSGVVVRSYDWVDAEGQTRFSCKRPSFASAWPRMYHALRALVPDSIYRAGMSLERVEQDGARVFAHFADGTRVAGDLLVAADGNASTVRRQFLPAVQPRYAGYVAWRGIVEERDLTPAQQAMIFGRIVASFPEDEFMLTMPNPGPGEDTRPGHRRCYFIWYRPATGARLTALFTDASGRHHGLAIPPPLVRREFVDELRAVAPRLFARELAEIVRLAPQPLLQAITDMESPALTFGRVVLLGDAAFVARPHVAAGLTKAALDAQCLADELAATPSDLDAALARYDRARQQFGTQMVAHSRYLGAYLEGRSKPPAARTPEETRRDPEQIIRDYGAPHLLRDVEVSRLEA